MSKNINPTIFTPVLIGGSLILLISFAIRSTFGLFQIPIAEQFLWARSEFSMAIAIQNLAWGIGTPIFSAFAEKFGDRKAITIGLILYALGIFISSTASSPEAHQFLNILIGFGIAGSGFGPILAVVGRTASAEKRSLALGITTAAGSAGQVVGPPFAALLLSIIPWSSVFVVFAIISILTIVIVPLLKSTPKITKKEVEENLSDALKDAFKDPTYIMLFLGFFSCGFQLAFITAHFPAFIAEASSPIIQGSLISVVCNSVASLGALSIALIGLFNIVGSIAAGAMGKHFTKKYLLSIIYTGRTIAAIAFIMLPITPTSVVVFSIVMGSLWLATVPLTSGIIGYIYGLKFMGTLYGIVFLSHQIGSFVGVWLGGLFYDIYGSYDLVWWVGIGVGAFSAIIHLPVKEIPLHDRKLITA
ncbi:MAG: MFS transporter [Proteobacteria bacterium]|nr:MFS transporter [Pseudomonadota bacterium]MDA1180982.1 MFS transporter [Pseudomonadota bacterium]